MAATDATAGPEMRITAVVPWFGSKRTLAPRIVQMLGPHRAYWEPFCGSLAPLLAKPPAAMETVNDLHGELVNLIRVLADRTTAEVLYERLLPLPMCEALFHETEQRSAARTAEEAGAFADLEPRVDRAFDFMVTSWQGRNGVIGTTKCSNGFCVRYTANGGHAATRWMNAVESIPAWHERLRNVVILRRDAFELLPRIEDAAGVCMYVDPPYLQKGARYVHDFETQDHGRLAEALRRFKRTRVVVSYYDDPRLAELYPGWAQTRVEVSKAMAHQGRRGENDTRAVEVLLCNQADGVAGGSLFGGEET